MEIVQPEELAAVGLRRGAGLRTLIVGAGALGGVLAARALAVGIPVALATRDAASADELRREGLRVSGIGGDVAVQVPRVGTLADLPGADFDLVVLATKAHDAIAAASQAARLLGPAGTLLTIQNGGVAEVLDAKLGGGRVLGGLSNLGATMVRRGVYEQRNAGHLLVGELGGAASERAAAVQAHLGRCVAVRTTTNMRGAVWSKLILNCAVTTPGAIAGTTMREYVRTSAGRLVFERAYDEALAVALASGARPERMLVEPVPPAWSGSAPRGEAYDAWVAEVVASYGDVKPSMLQDFERGRPTEIDLINGHVVASGRALGVATPVNGALVEAAHAISGRRLAPSVDLLGRILAEAPARGAR